MSLRFYRYGIPLTLSQIQESCVAASLLDRDGSCKMKHFLCSSDSSKLACPRLQLVLCHETTHLLCLPDTVKSVWRMVFLPLGWNSRCTHRTEHECCESGAYQVCLTTVWRPGQFLSLCKPGTPSIISQLACMSSSL